MNFYAKSYAITKFDCSYYNEIFTINNDSTPILLWYMCGHAICAREVSVKRLWNFAVKTYK